MHSRPVISYPIPTPVAQPSALGEAFDDQGPPTPNLGLNNGFQREGGSGHSRSVSGQTRGPASTLDSFITRLLVVTKQLLQGLEQWSQRQLTEEDVSDIYVRLGNGFELCVSAFRKVGISTADLDSVPNDLRVILERALGEEPSTETLNVYLPDIRAIIFNLLSGLKNKQIAYKRLLSDRNQPDAFSASSSHRSAPKPSEPDLPRSVPSSNRSDRTASPIPVPSAPPPAAALAERSQQRQTRPPPPDAFRPPRSRSAQDTHPVPESSRRASVSSEAARLQRSSGSQARPIGGRPLLHTPPKDRYSRDAISRFSDDSDTADSRRGSDASSLHNSVNLRSPPAVQPPTLPPIPTSPPLPQLNLPLDHLQADLPNDAAVALQRSDALERRASKRFSSYTFNKMVPASSPNAKRSSTSGSPPRPARRSDRLPAVIEDHNAPPLPDLAKSIEHARKASMTERPAVPTLKTIPASPGMGDSAEEQLSAGPSVTAARKSRAARDSAASTMSTPSTITAYLQLGRQVKKTHIELPTDMSTLKLLFMERFEYDPGMEDFPNVYIRDSKTGVQYELEDMKDLQEGCVLTLDIEPLDQVKQHFDLTFASLSAEIKELKTALTQPKRLSMAQPLATSLLSVSASQPRLPVGTPDATMIIHSSPRSPDTSQVFATEIESDAAKISTPTASSANLRVHYDEVQSLRRDLAIMRQLHLDFINQTKESFGALREQNTAMREVVKTKMGGSRALLDNSKAKLEAQCQDTIQSVEEVSDIIDGAREDALRRGVTPSKSKMEKIKEDLTKATALVERFTTDVAAAEPTWRATWLTELQRVTEEQRLLAYQNKLAADLKNDIKDATEMLGNVQAFVDQRKAAPRKGFMPSEPEEGGGGITNLLMEIRTKEADPSQRLRAIEEQQRARERDLANRTDEFQNELSGFVTGKKLRMTGGTDEAERVRQRRQEQTLRRMLSGDIPGEPPGVLAPPQRRAASDGGSAPGRNSGASSAGGAPS